MNQRTPYLLNYFFDGIDGPEKLTIASAADARPFAETALHMLGDSVGELGWFDLSGEESAPLDLLSSLEDDEVRNAISQIDDFLKSKGLGYMELKGLSSDADDNEGRSMLINLDESELGEHVSKQEIRILAAARNAAQAQVHQIVREVIAAMQDMDPVGLVGDVLARHVWDEYCWQLQDGPYDSDDIGFGSTAQNFHLTAVTFIDGELEKIPPAAKQLLAAYICEEGGLCDGCEACDCTSEEIKTFVLERVDTIAASRRLELLGPDRADVISYDHNLGGIVGKAFSESGEHAELLSLHADDLISGDSLAQKRVCAELLDHYMELLNAASADSDALTELLTRFDAEIRTLVLEKELRPQVEDLVGQLQETLDDF